MGYTVEFDSSAQRDLDGLDPQVRRRVIARCSALEQYPVRGPNIRPLRTYQGTYRLRVGDWRVVYRVEGNKVLVIMVGHRSSIYRGL